MVSRFSRHLLCLWFACWAMPQSVAQERATTSTNIGDWLRLLDATAHRLIAIRPGHDTTRITEPRTDDGYIDYTEALNRLASQGVNRNNNAACLLWRVVGRDGADCPRSYFDSGWFRMVKPPADQPMHRFDDYDTYVRRKNGLVFQGMTREQTERLLFPFDEALARGVWRKDDFPLVAQWLEAMDEPLAIIAKAARRPRYFSPAHRCLLDEDGRLLAPKLLSAFGEEGNWFQDPLYAIRWSLGAFRLRAALRIGHGRPREAWEDIATCHRLARLWMQSLLMQMYLAGCQAEITANEATFLLATSGTLTQKELEEILARRQRMTPWKLPTRQFDLGMRFVALDLTQEIPRRRRHPLRYLVGFGTGSSQPYRQMQSHFDACQLWWIDWNRVMWTVNRRHDEALRLLNIHDHTVRDARLESMRDYYWKWQQVRLTMRFPYFGVSPVDRLMAGRMKKSDEMAEMVLLVGGWFPYAGVYDERYRRVATYSALGDLSVAVALYKARHGGYPQSLEDLAPRTLGELPTDLWGRSPYGYRRTRTGCIVYSVGRNGVDDEGKSDDGSSRSVALDDIAVRFGGNSDE